MDKPVIVESIEKSFKSKNKELVAVDGISFDISEGEIVCLLGPNGSGKTTTLKMVCGLIEPDTGSVKILNQTLSGNKQLLRYIGVMLEGSRNIYPYLSPLENIKYYARIQGIDGEDMLSRAEEMLKSFSLDDRKNDSCSTFSLGMQQKVALCCTMISEPEILLLDEPTSGLDVITKIDVISTIQRLKEKGASILLMTHQMDVAEKLADRIIIINKGKIVVEGTPTSLSQYVDSSVFRITLQESAESARPLLESFANVAIEDNEIIISDITQQEMSDLFEKLTASKFNVLSISKNLTLEESVIQLMERSK